MLKGKSRARAHDQVSQPTAKPETQPAASAEDVLQTTTKRRRRHASVYDAVAGRVGLNGFITKKHAGNGVHDRDLRSPNKIKPLAPEEVLLRRVHAPTHAPLGYYAADQALPPERRLPDSDLLKAVHAYASDFYYSIAPTSDGTGCDFRSMNETALLALGILLEEAAVEVLGEAGDMVLVEPEGLEKGLPEERITRHQVRGRVRPLATPEPEAESEEEMADPEVEEVEVRRRKRRRFNAFV